MKFPDIPADIFISDSQENPYLNYTRPNVYNKGYPFLRRSSSIFPHKEAMEIINALHNFYELNSEQDIKDINEKLQSIMSDEIPEAS